VSADPADFSYSVVIPVYNSQDVVGRTIDAVLEVFEAAGLRHQVVLVNDGSRDGSWDVISARAAASPRVVALDLLRNYGQHHANVAGMREATGDYVITLDDDLQNPPDQVLLLIEKAMEGHDVVFGRFERKQARGYRRLGSRAISMINRRVFDQPPGLAVSNFRILRRDVVERICGSRTAHPYITGQALMFSSDPADVLVRHDPRPVGTSNYGLRRIASLVLTILFSYSVFPLRLAAVTIGRTDTALGAFYRRLSARIGKAKAVTARKIAVLFYNTLRHGMNYTDPGASYYEERYRQRVLTNLQRRAKALERPATPQRWRAITNREELGRKSRVVPGDGLDARRRSTAADVVSDGSHGCRTFQKLRVVGVKTFGKRLTRKIGKKREGDGDVRMHAHTLRLCVRPDAGIIRPSRLR